MLVSFHEDALQEYIYWQFHDKKTLKRINDLLRDIERNGAAKGIGKPEPLKRRSAWSRRIDDMHRLVYNVEGDTLYILSLIHI